MKKYYLKIEFKRGDDYTPEVIETYWYRKKFFRWWKIYIDTVGLIVKTNKNGCIEKYSLDPYFTEWEEYNS